MWDVMLFCLVSSSWCFEQTMILQSTGNYWQCAGPYWQCAGPCWQCAGPHPRRFESLLKFIFSCNLNCFFLMCCILRTTCTILAVGDDSVHGILLPWLIMILWQVTSVCTKQTPKHCSALTEHSSVQKYAVRYIIYCLLHGAESFLRS